MTHDIGIRMNEKKFDPKKLDKLNNPQRLLDIPIEYIWNKIHLTDPVVLVDIGAGTGFFSVPFLKYVKNGKIFACDTSDIMIQWMKNNICPQYPDIVPLKMEESAVPLEDGIADLVYMINLHHELDQPQTILEESFRILKKRTAPYLLLIGKKKICLRDLPCISDTCRNKLRTNWWALTLKKLIFLMIYQNTF